MPFMFVMFGEFICSKYCCIFTFLCVAHKTCFIFVQRIIIFYVECTILLLALLMNTDSPLVHGTHLVLMLLTARISATYL
jgi:hypothetical protein